MVLPASMVFIVQGALGVTINGSVLLFLACVALSLFATLSIGIFMATLTRSVPQSALARVLVLIPLQWLSGGTTPTDSMPVFVQNVMLLAPTTHFVAAAQAILYRGAGFDVIWPQFLANLAIGAAFFAIALSHFRRTISQMA